MGSDRDGACELYVSDRATGVRLSVRTLEQARQRPRRDRRGQGEIRLTADEVAALLDDSSI